MPRPTDWVDTLVNLEVPIAGQTAGSLVTGLFPLNTRGMTVIRTIISLGMFSNTIAGAWGVMRVDLAIGIASQEAFSAGIFPDPNTATEKPPRGWMWRTERLVSQNGAGAPIVVDIEADIRGARKVENGEVYILANNTAQVGTFFQVNVLGLVRQLYKV